MLDNQYLNNPESKRLMNAMAIKSMMDLEGRVKPLEYWLDLYDKIQCENNNSEG